MRGDGDGKADGKSARDCRHRSCVLGFQTRNRYDAIDRCAKDVIVSIAQDKHIRNHMKTHPDGIQWKVQDIRPHYEYAQSPNSLRLGLRVDLRLRAALLRKHIL